MIACVSKLSSKLAAMFLALHIIFNYVAIILSFLIPITSNEALLGLLVIIDLFILLFRHILNHFFKNEDISHDAVYAGVKFEIVGTFAIKFVALMRA
jgi:hypothetical protein